MALTELDDRAALAFFEQDVLRHLAEVVQIARNRPPWARRVLADGRSPNTVMVLTERPAGPHVLISGHDDRFTAAALRFVADRHDGFQLSTLDPRVLEHPLAVEWAVEGAGRTGVCLACTSVQAAAATLGGPRILASGDQDRFLRYPHDDAGEGPSPERLFRWLVLDGGGEIFGVDRDGELLGWLACMPEHGDIWDVAFVHVREERRNQGLGAQLAAAYASERLRRAQVAYYSSPSGPASERAALKGGFRRCREEFIVRLSPGRRPSAQGA